MSFLKQFVHLTKGYDGVSQSGQRIIDEFFSERNQATKATKASDCNTARMWANNKSIIITVLHSQPLLHISVFSFIKYSSMLCNISQICIYIYIDVLVESWCALLLCALLVTMCINEPATVESSRALLSRMWCNWSVGFHWISQVKRLLWWKALYLMTLVIVVAPFHTCRNKVKMTNSAFFEQTVIDRCGGIQHILSSRQCEWKGDRF